MPETTQDFEIYLPIPRGLPEDAWRPVALNTWRSGAQEIGVPVGPEPHTIETATPPPDMAEAIRASLRGVVSDPEDTDFAHVVGQVKIR